jgi:hypothetical protein
MSVALMGVNIAYAESLLQEVSRIQLPGVESRIDRLSAEMSSKRLFVAGLFRKSWKWCVWLIAHRPNPESYLAGSSSASPWRAP